MVAVLANCSSWLNLFINSFGTGANWMTPRSSFRIGSTSPGEMPLSPLVIDSSIHCQASLIGFTVNTGLTAMRSVSSAALTSMSILY